jgi:hypothetical protein
VRNARSAISLFAKPDALSADGDVVCYLGSLLMREDEVVLCRFEGSERAVRRVAEGAAIPSERILEAGHSPWAGKPGALELERREDDRDASP